jgi:hypothetical protein
VPGEVTVDGLTRPVSGRAVYAALALVVVSQVTAHLVDFGVYDLRLRLLNAGLDGSVFSVFAPAAMAVGAAAAVAYGARAHDRGALALGGAMTALVALGLFNLRGRTPASAAVFLPLLLLVLVLLLRADRRPPFVGRGLQTGCIVLVAAFALHEFGGVAFTAVGIHVMSWPYQVKVALKEAGQIIGWWLVAFALVGGAVQAAKR